MQLLLLGLFLSLVCMTQAFAPRAGMVQSRAGRTELSMGGKQSKFGIFSPAVLAAKAVLGEGKLNKIRGKAISLHSQAITEWCLQYGAYNLRLRLIKKAKKNGDELGFLI
jgi:hypothetical protein